MISRKYLPKLSQVSKYGHATHAAGRACYSASHKVAKDASVRLAVTNESMDSLPLRLEGLHSASSLQWTFEELRVSRHLLRAVLRECTYLPDKRARTYIRTHVLDRFRAYMPPHKSLELVQERRYVQIKLARKALSELRRANAGELKVLTKVLHLTYGRIGKRRHELLEPLLQHEPDLVLNGAPESSIDTLTTLGTQGHVSGDAAAPSLSSTSSERDSALPRLSAKLNALLISQVRTSPSSPTRSHPKNLTPDIPELNTWERPMPFKRVKNMTKRWYAKVLDRTLPPIPTAEWEELKGRALGTIKFEGPVKRRTRTSEEGTEDTNLGNELLEKQLGLTDLSDVEMILQRVDENAKGSILTQRFMQRRWAAIFAQCARMEWDHENGRWRIEWGSDVLQIDSKLKAVGHELMTFAPSPAPPRTPAPGEPSKRQLRKEASMQRHAAATAAVE